MKRRAIIIVLDSVGIGALPDAHEFGDAGAHTIGHVYAKMNGLNIPNLSRLGINAIEGSTLPPLNVKPAGSYGRAMEVTMAKDTTSGHWEMAGFVMDKPFRTYPNGFPHAFIEEFESRIGRKTLGNCVASGTKIIEQLGDEHVATGRPIVYTSADSVFQIAAHEDVISLDELYRICETARGMLMGENLVGRVIARPFSGKRGVYTRTENRRDYALEPMADTILDGLTAQGFKTIGIGKIEDIFARRGITIADHTKNNHDGIEAAIRFIRSGEGDFIFVNLVDFDMLYGHRNDYRGYGRAIEYFDTRLPEILNSLNPGDLLIITADHGCDPTYPGTDHTREYIPILAFAPGLSGGINLGTRESFADIGATAYAYITGTKWPVGKSFLQEITQPGEADIYTH